MNQNEIERFFRLELCPFSRDTIFQGFYQDSYVFCRAKTNPKNRFRLRDVEYLKKEEINKAIREWLHEDQTFDSNQNLDTGEGGGVFEYQLMNSDEERHEKDHPSR